MIKRGNTAIARTKHSKPYQYLVKNNLIHMLEYVLDYGCGKGYDVEQLKKAGYRIKGYDKFQENYNDLHTLDYVFDVVTCNYVLNVIEDNVERLKVIEELRDLANQVYITVRSDKKSIKDTWTKYNDGWITTKGTFQKFFTVSELEEMCCTSEDWDFSVLTNNSNEIMISMKYLGGM